MGRYVIDGGNMLSGEVNISGAKNAVLPMLAASVLVDGCVLSNVPDLRDVDCAIEILQKLGSVVRRDGDTLNIDNSRLKNTPLTEKLVGRMRSSIVFAGGLLGRFGRADIAYPGGCALGARPIDIHIHSFSKMNINPVIKDEGMSFTTTGIKGAILNLRCASVGATENIMIAAATGEGETIIFNAAKEPEIADLAAFLNSAGADIRGGGTDTVIISGVKKLNNCKYRVMPDRIEAGTFLCAAAATGGEIFLNNANAAHLKSLIGILRRCGCYIKTYDNKIYMEAPKKLIAVESIATKPYPGLPTDIQPQLMAVLCTAKGKTRITENIFEARNKHIGELVKMGADINMEDGMHFVVNGVDKLKGAVVDAKDLRGGAALVIAALAAEGRSVVNNSGFVERGYEGIEEKLSLLGGEVKII